METEKEISEKDRQKLQTLGSYLGEIGWFRSAQEGMPCDNRGNALPWYTYPSIRFLEERIQSDMTIFEYGSGNSTLWWSKRVDTVVSCEHDQKWYQRLSKKLPSNVDYKYCELEYGGSYGKIISSFHSEFDCIVIDGRDRVNCAKNALGALKKTGVIIWDDGDRVNYQEGYSFLIENEFRRIEFWGLGPNSSSPWCTSVFYRNQNCLGI